MSFQEAMSGFLEHAVPVLVAGLLLILNIFGIYLLSKLPEVTKKGIDWLEHKVSGIKNASERVILQRLVELAGQKVLMLEQTEVKLIQDKLRAGTIKKEDIPGLLSDMKRAAVEEVKSSASSQELWNDAKIVFKDNESELIKWLEHVIESQVYQLPSQPVPISMNIPHPDDMSHIDAGQPSQSEPKA